MRKLAPALLVIATAFVPAHRTACASDAPAAAAAALALAASEENDAARLRGVAVSCRGPAGPDPWIVAHHLYLTGSTTAARAFATAWSGACEDAGAAEPVRALWRADAAALAAFFAKDATSAADPDVTKLCIGLAATPADEDADPPAGFAAACTAALPRADAVGRVRLRMTIASTFAAEGDLEAALANAEAAAEAASGIGWTRAKMQSHDLAGLLGAYMQRPDVARRHWGSLAEQFDAAGFTSNAIATRLNLASLLIDTGAYESAIAAIDAVDAALRTLPAESAARVGLRAAMSRAFCLYRWGRFGDAVVAFERACDGMTAPEHAPLLLETSVMLAEAQIDLGDFEGARRRITGISKRLEDPAYDTLRFKAQGALGRAARVAGDFPAAVRIFRELRDASVTRDNHDEVLLTRTSLGFALLRSGDLAGAATESRAALQMTTAVPNPFVRANLLANLAQIKVQGSDAEAAERAYTEAHDAATLLGARAVIAEVEAIGAEAAHRRGDHGLAVARCRASADAVLRSVAGLAEGQGAEAREQHAAMFDLALRAALASGDAATVLEMAERGRAVTLIEGLEGAAAARNAAIPESLRAAEREARIREGDAAAAHRTAVAGRDLASIRTARKDLDAAREQVQQVVARIQREAGAGAAAFYPQPPDAAALRASLGEGECIVLYLTAGSDMHAVIATRTEMRVASLGRSAAVDAACMDPTFRTAGAPDAADPPAVGVLRERIAAPLALPQHIRHVYVSAAGGVHRAPLAAAFDGVTISLIPSAAAFLAQRSAPRNAAASDGVLAAGNPDARSHGLPDLPESAAEARAVGTVVLIGKDATEAAVRKALAAKTGRWRAVHLAMHGVIDAARPLRSALALTPAAPDDGLLTALEIHSMRCDADVVVLAACESGTGRILRTEGVLGLPRAFLQAGAGSVVASLWKVDDRATHALMAAFHARIKTGESPAAALRAAQDVVKADPRWRHPAYWAAWVVWDTGGAPR